MGRRWARRKSSPEDQGEETRIKGTMEKRALRDYQGRKGLGAATEGRGGRKGAEAKRRKSAGWGLGYFTKVSKS